MIFTIYVFREPPESCCLAYDFRPQQTKVFPFVSSNFLLLELNLICFVFSLSHTPSHLLIESEKVEQLKWLKVKHSFRSKKSGWSE